MAKPILLIRGMFDKVTAEAFGRALKLEFNDEYHFLYIYDEDRFKPDISVIGENNPILSEETKTFLQKLTFMSSKELEKFINEQERNGNIKT